MDQPPAVVGLNHGLLSRDRDTPHPVAYPGHGELPAGHLLHKGVCILRHVIPPVGGLQQHARVVALHAHRTLSQRTAQIQAVAPRVLSPVQAGVPPLLALDQRDPATDLPDGETR